MEGVNLRYNVNTYVSIRMYLPIQLLYVKKRFKNHILHQQNYLGHHLHLTRGSGTHYMTSIIMTLE